MDAGSRRLLRRKLLGMNEINQAAISIQQGQWYSRLRQSRLANSTDDDRKPRSHPHSATHPVLGDFFSSPFNSWSRADIVE